MKPNKCRVMCPDCGKSKMQFETESAAKRFIEFNGSEISDKPEELRVYYCPACCCYHISSKPHSEKYEHRTERLINAYHKYTEEKATEIGTKMQIIKNIIGILNLEPNILIDKTGQFHVVSFKTVGNIVLGLDDSGNTHNIEKCNLDELESMLKKLIIKHYKIYETTD